MLSEMEEGPCFSPSSPKRGSRLRQEDTAIRKLSTWSFWGKRKDAVKSESK